MSNGNVHQYRCCRCGVRIDIRIPESVTLAPGSAWTCFACKHKPPSSPGGDSHYTQGGIQPADLILSNDLVGWKAIALEYLFRAGHKGDEAEDIEKAMWWMQKRMDMLK